MRNVSTLIIVCLGFLFPLLSHAQPIANFTSNRISGCSPIVVQFTDLSTGNPNGWSWNLGNGVTSTMQHPSTTYITPGTYTVSLTVSNGSGNNQKTVTNYITVYSSPIVSFTADSLPSCAPKNTQFNNLTVLGSAGTYSYLWDFGDGDTSMQTNPSHTYTAIGNYNVTLIATNSHGCTKSLTKINYIPIVSKPIANFSASNTNGCVSPFGVNFTNTSANAVSYNWDFGDGGTSVLATPTHTYNTNGTYTVRLIATNSSGCKDTLTRVSYIKIGLLNSQFSMSSNSICAGEFISFTNSTTPGGSTSNWSFGDGGTSTVLNPAHQYAVSGTYPVRLISSLNGCNDTSVQTVTVRSKPSIQFTAPNTLGCAVPFMVQFANTTTNAVSYLWSFGDGNTSTATNPTHSYSVFANYGVRLIAVASNGCADTLTKANFVKVQTPSAVLATNLDSGCIPLTVNFTSSVNSQLPVTNFSWDFGDGSAVQSCASCASKSHTYTTTGTYTAVLSYSTGAGCTFTVQKTIKAGTKPTANFNVSPSSACPGYPITCTNTSTGATSYLWNDGAGNNTTATNPVFGYKSGTYTIRLIAFNRGCPDTITKNVTIHLPRAGFTTNYSCNNRLNISFTDQSAGANTYYWNFGDGNTSTTSGNTSHTYAGYGTYYVKLGVKNNASGCTDTFYRTLKLVPLISSFAADDTTICRYGTVAFSANPSYQYLNYSWNFGNTQTTTNIASTTTTYNIPGIFTTKLVVTDSIGCKDSTTKVNYIKVGGASVNFTGAPLGGCLPLTVNFQDQSVPNGGFSIVSRNWTFGNGNTSTQTNPSSIYSLVGTYNVTLNITDANGCVSSMTRNNYVTASKPVAAFSSSTTTYCIGSTVTFSNTSTGNLPVYTWYYGDGSSSIGPNGSHTYASSGQYSVKLVVTDTYGCKDSLIRTNYINVIAPVLSFTVSDTSAPCPPLAVNFTNTSIDTTNIVWRFGNGSQSLTKHPSATYTYPGVYTAKLIAQTTNGCTDSVTKTITVYGPTGTFSYSPQSGCSPLLVSFSATTNNTSLLIWDMNNGITQSTTSGSFTYTYTQRGRFVPRLILSDNASCLVPIVGSDTIVVDAVDADFNFSPQGLCDSGTVQFTDTVLMSLTSVATRKWFFGDGGSSTAHNPSHKYLAPGSYQVRFIVSNTRGCFDTVEKTILIHALPNVTATNNQAICQGTIATVNLLATGASSYTWSPSAGLSCVNCANPTALPASTTVYTVRGVDANGCSDTGIVTITVNPRPVINLGNNQAVCSGDSVQITATGAATYVWSPSLGLSCTVCNNPYAKPLFTTTYKVVGTSSFGCSDSNFIIVTVNPLPAVNAGPDTVICFGNTTSLQASGGVSYTWTPATGLSCTSCANPSASPALNTVYRVRGVNANGCANTDEVFVKVNPLPNVSAGVNKAICAGYPTSLTATGAVNYTWSPTTGLSCSNCATPNAGPSGTTTYTLTGSDTNGCVNTSNVTVTVNAIPIIGVNGKSLMCEGDTSQLLASGASSYVWSPAGSLSCSGCFNPIASPTVTTSYKVVGTQNGCSDSANIIINVRPKPNVSVGGGKSICVGGFVKLMAVGAKTYTWTPATGLSCANCANPTATPVSTMTYTITGQDSFGCSNTTQLTVTVNQSPSIDAGVDVDLCDGSFAILKATGAQNYSWYPNTNISCVNCVNPSVNPDNIITYHVTGTDINGCIDSDFVTVNVIKKGPISIGKGDTLCRGEFANLSASGGTSYLWMPPLGLSGDNIPNPTASPDITTDYTVVIRQGDCFTDTGHVLITVNDLPQVYAGEDRRVSAGSLVTLNAEGDNVVSYEWSPREGLSCPDCPSPTTSPRKSVTYTVTVKNEWGCFAKDDIDISVSCDAGLLYIPNTFTPNGDGYNDRFYPQGRGISEVKRFSVFNRWGQLLFEAFNIPLNEPNLGWDGTYKNEQLKPDVFVYILNATCDGGEPIELKGDISLIR